MTRKVWYHGYITNSPSPGDAFDTHMSDIIIYNLYEKSYEESNITIQLSNAPGTKSHTNSTLSCVSKGKSFKVYVLKIVNRNPPKMMQPYLPSNYIPHKNRHPHLLWKIFSPSVHISFSPNKPPISPIILEINNMVILHSIFYAIGWFREPYVYLSLLLCLRVSDRE